MSHFSVLVITETDDEGAVAEALAPYQENNMGDCPEQYLSFYDATDEVVEHYSKLSDEERKEYPDLLAYAKDYWGYTNRAKEGEEPKFGHFENVNAKWDWWSIGGRWSGFLKTKGEPALGSTGLMGMHYSREDGSTDFAQVCDIDWDAMMDEAGREAAERYDLVRPVMDASEPYVAFDVFRDQHENIDAARKAYWDQPVIEAVRANEEARVAAGWGMDLASFLVSRDEYVERARRSAIVPFAILDDEGWHERGEMGWWAIVNNEDENWEEVASERLLNLNPYHYVTVVDCHI